MSLEELVLRSLAAYVVQAEPAFKPIGFGIWANRPEMQDAAKWNDRRKLQAAVQQSSA